MKIKCNRSELLTAVFGVSRAVSNKSVIPAIEGILFKATLDRVILTGYDLEIGITTTISAEVEKNGEIIINARLLHDIIRKLNDDVVTISANQNNSVSLTCGITKFDFMGLPASDFPELPYPNTDNSLTINGKDLKEMIEKTLFAVAQDNQKPVHTGVKFFLGINDITLVSVDGYRLATCHKKIINTDEREFVIPAKTLSEISRLIGESEEDVFLSTAKRYAVFSLKGYTVVTRLLEGDFLDYKKAIPDGYKTKVLINVTELYESVERTSLVITDRYRSPVRLRFDNSVAQIRCNTNIGSSYDEVRAEIEGNPVEIGFNNKYVLDALRNCREENVYLLIGDPVSPMKIVPEEGDDFLFLVLPVRIKSD
ncbi:MAG: DNA polymerase III subunit beta [Ruminococcaceae bacterium]|nr:DNA polymerase III subunit beta [Oscillospiraceae bacterium]